MRQSNGHHNENPGNKHPNENCIDQMLLFGIGDTENNG